MGIISKRRLSGKVIVFQMVDLHSKLIFQSSLGMIHARDVIKSSFKRSDQKPKTESFSKTVIFSGFYGYSQQTIINLNVDFPSTLQYHYQLVRKLSIKSNWLTVSLPEVKVIIVKLAFSDESTHNC